KSMLKNILFNLLSNAFKFSDDGSEIIIYVSTISKKVRSRLVSYVKISVLNFGPVISKEDIPLIFEQFYQLPYKQKNLGSGIGLSLTKRLVELHRGKIIVSSSETKGTRFSILLRLGNEHLEKNECIEQAEILEGCEEDFYYMDVGEDQVDIQQEAGVDRSEERRVGKEWRRKRGTKRD